MKYIPGFIFMSCFADFTLCKPWLLQDNIKTTNCHQNWSILLFTDALQARQLKLNLYYGSEASQISAAPLNSWLLLYVLLNLKQIQFYLVILISCFQYKTYRSLMIFLTWPAIWDILKLFESIDSFTWTTHICCKNKLCKCGYAQ